MATSSCLSKILILCLATALLILQSPPGPAASGSHDQRLLGWAPARSGCRGTIAECLAAANQDESDDSEISSSRRVLSAYVYISYGALQRNTVPCSQRGASYYNCYGAQVNPYTRGCSVITLCRS